MPHRGTGGQGLRHEEQVLRRQLLPRLDDVLFADGAVEPAGLKAVRSWLGSVSHRNLNRPILDGIAGLLYVLRQIGQRILDGFGFQDAKYYIEDAEKFTARKKFAWPFTPPSGMILSPDPLPRSRMWVPGSIRSTVPRVAHFSGVNGL